MVGLWGWGSNHNNATAATAAAAAAANTIPNAPTPAPGQVQVNQCQGKKINALPHLRSCVLSLFSLSEIFSLTTTTTSSFPS